MSVITELIKEIRECAKSVVEFYNNPNDQIAIILNQAADTIEELSAKLHSTNMERSSQYYHGGWIPAVERLPEYYSTVLVQFKKSTDGITMDDDGTVEISWMRTTNNMWITNSGTFTTDDILAWMPLLQPYLPNEEVD